jgi:hypothetical protein
MGNLIGDVAFGGQSRTDRQQLTDMYKVLNPAAKSATEEGLSAQGQALKHAEDIAGGNRQAQQEAIAPIENTASAQQQAERRRLESEGTSRGGGVNAAQQAGANRATQTAVNALTSLLPQATAQEAGIGGALTGEGLRAASELDTAAEAERRTNLAHQAAEGSDVAKGIGAVAGGFGGGAAAAPNAGLSGQAITGAASTVDPGYSMPQELPLESFLPQ